MEIVQFYLKYSFFIAGNQQKFQIIKKGIYKLLNYSMVSMSFHYFVLIFKAKELLFFNISSLLK